MPPFTKGHALFLGVFLESVVYGIYVSFFVHLLVLQRRSRRKFWSGPLVPLTTILFVLCTVYLAGAVADEYLQLSGPPWSSSPTAANLNLLNSVTFSIVDCLTQLILIYRCWLIWGKNYFVVFLPALMSLTVLASEFALVGLLADSPTARIKTIVPLGTAAFSISLGVNAIITVLIVYKIWGAARVSRNIHSTPDNSLQIVMTMLIESGFMIFVVQLLYVVLFSTQDDVGPAYDVVIGLATITYGIAPTILAVRVRLGASFENGQDAAKSITLRFASEPSSQSADTRVRAEDLEGGVVNDSEGQLGVYKTS